MSDLCSCKQKKGELMYGKYRDIIDTSIASWSNIDDLVKNRWVIFANNIKTKGDAISADPANHGEKNRPKPKPKNI